MERFFEEAFQRMDADRREDFYKTVFMQDASEYAEKLRIEYYSKKLRHMGKNVRIGAGVKLFNPQFISLGDNVTLMDNAALIARGEGGIEIGDNAILCERVYLDTETAEWGYIKVGSGVYIGTGTTLFGHKGLEIGDSALLAQNITLTPYSHIFDDPDKPIVTQGGHMRKVTIGRDSYIGMRVSIMYSADIGEGSVIGAGSVVVKPIPPYSVAVGQPARVIKERK